MGPLYSGVPVSHAGVTVSQHERYQDTELIDSFNLNDYLTHDMSEYLLCVLILVFLSIVSPLWCLFRSCSHAIKSLQSVFSAWQQHIQQSELLCLLYFGFLFSLCWFLAPPSVRSRLRAVCLTKYQSWINVCSLQELKSCLSCLITKVAVEESLYIKKKSQWFGKQLPLKEFNLSSHLKPCELIYFPFYTKTYVHYF